MKKVFTSVLCAMFLLTGVAFADSPCSGPQCVGTGSFNTEAKAFNAVGDIDFAFGGNSAAFNANGAIGGAHSQAAGSILNGKVGAASNGGTGPGVVAVGTAFETGGAIANYNYAYAGSHNIAGTHAMVNVYVDPAGNGFTGPLWNLKPTAFGAAGGTISGFAAQGSINGTVVVGDGITGGIAKQGSIGGFVGSAGVISGPDSYYGGSGGVGKPGFYEKQKGANAGEIKFFQNGHPENNSEWKFVGKYYSDSKANAGVGAGIDMFGGSFSQSQRVVGPEYVGLRTDVGAYTNVSSYGGEWGQREGLAGYNTELSGGWKAAGELNSGTIMNHGNFATANGQYAGAGDLGCNYEGGARGYTQVEKFTSPTMNGASYRSEGQMHVTSKTFPAQGGQPQ